MRLGSARVGRPVTRFGVTPSAITLASYRTGLTTREATSAAWSREDGPARGASIGSSGAARRSARTEGAHRVAPKRAINRGRSRLTFGPGLRVVVRVADDGRVIISATSTLNGIAIPAQLSARTCITMEG